VLNNSTELSWVFHYRSDGGRAEKEGTRTDHLYIASDGPTFLREEAQGKEQTKGLEQILETKALGHNLRQHEQGLILKGLLCDCLNETR
jgi:hypothetical protein